MEADGTTRLYGIKKHTRKRSEHLIETYRRVLVVEAILRARNIAPESVTAGQVDKLLEKEGLADIKMVTARTKAGKRGAKNYSSGCFGVTVRNTKTGPRYVAQIGGAGGYWYGGTFDNLPDARAKVEIEMEFRGKLDAIEQKILQLKTELKQALGRFSILDGKK